MIALKEDIVNKMFSEWYNNSDVHAFRTFMEKEFPHKTIVFREHPEGIGYDVLVDEELAMFLTMKYA